MCIDTIKIFENQIKVLYPSQITITFSCGNLKNYSAVGRIHSNKEKTFTAGLQPRSLASFLFLKFFFKIIQLDCLVFSLFFKLI